MAGNNGAFRNADRGIIVQPRDLVLLRELATMKVADCEQIKIVAGFGSTGRANTRLLQLVRAGLLRRFFLGSGGGRKALYALSEKGAQLAQVPYGGPRRKHDAILVADFFIAHQLRVNEIYCTLKFKKLPEGIAFHRWIVFHEAITPNLGLIPDGYVELQTPAGIVASFLEIDLGHESLAVWTRKVKNYLQLALSGDYERKFGQRQFRVLVLATSPRRRDTIRKAVSAITEKVFRFATLDQGLFTPVWLRPAGGKPEPLIETHPS